MTTELGMLSLEFPGVLELPRHLYFRGYGNLCFLAYNGMTKLAILTNDFSFSTRMIPFMTLGHQGGEFFMEANP